MKEIRHTEIRAQQNENKEMIITGTPIVFDTPTKINDPLGQYTEIIKRGALDGVDLTDTRLLVSHDMKRIPLARAPKTMALNIDDKGLHIRAILPDTEEGRSVYTAVKRGDIDGMSFSFSCDSGGNHYDAETRTRTISKFKKIYETSIVNFPAYQATSVEARSQMQEADENQQAKTQLKLEINQTLRRDL